MAELRRTRRSTSAFARWISGVTNHNAGGLAQADFDLASTIDGLPGA
jgi:hypothetical protein